MLPSHPKAGWCFADRLRTSLLAALILAVLPPGGQAQSVFFVAPNGDDANPGTLAEPFATLAHATATVPSSSTLRLRGGVYRESVEVIRSTLGTAANPFVIEAYDPGSGPEQVVLSGFEPVVPSQDGTGTWQLHSGNIYKIQTGPAFGLHVGADTVLLNGSPMTQARWPNAPAPFDFDYRNMAAAESASVDPASGGGQPPYDYRGTFHTATYGHAGLPALPLDAWVGARILTSPGPGDDQSVGVVTASDSGSISFRYLRDGHGDATVGDPFFIWNTLDALDQEGEAFFDIEGVSGPANTLYVWLPGGADPTSHQVEVRARQRGLYFRSGSHAVVRHIEFEGADLYVAPSFSDITLENLHVRYAGSGLDLLLSNSGTACISLGGPEARVTDTHIRRSYAGGIVAPNDAATVENNVIERCMLYGVGTWGGTNHVVQRNTIFESGALCIAMFSPASVFNRNHCYLGGLHSTDEALMNTNYNGDLQNTEVAWNWVHSNPNRNNGGRGIRLDSGTGGVSNVLVHHNLIWNTGKEGGLVLHALPVGAVNYGNTQIRAYHNTVEGNISLRGRGTGSGTSIAGHEVHNNIAWDIYYNSSGLTASNVTNNIRSNPADLSLFPGNPLTSHLHVSAPFGNFQLLDDSLAVDTATPVAGINDTFTGAGPDLGALEHVPTSVRHWTAGATIREKDFPAIQASFVGHPSGELHLALTNFPTGRVLPDNFSVRLGGQLLLADFVHSYDLEAHAATARFPVPAGSLSGIQTLELSLDGSTYQSAGSIAVPSGALDLQSGENLAGSPVGGSQATLHGSGFSNLTWKLPITIDRHISRDLTEVPVPVVLDTATQIASGRMEADGSDLRFEHLESGTVLDHWIESGLNTDSTLCWLRLPESILDRRFSQADESTLYLSFGDPSRTDVSKRETLFDYYSVLDRPSLLLWIRANDLTATTTDGSQVPLWPDQSPLGQDGIQGIPTLQPTFRKDSVAGLPALEFDAAHYFLHGELTATPDPRLTYFVIYKREGGTTLDRMLSAGTSASNELFHAQANSGQLGTWSTKYVKRNNFGLPNFTTGRKSSTGARFFDGLMAEAILFNEELDSLGSAPYVRAQDYLNAKYELQPSARCRVTTPDPLPPLRLFAGGVPIDTFTVVDDGTITFTVPAAPGGLEIPTLLDLTVESANLSSTLKHALIYYTPNYPTWSAPLVPGGLDSPTLDIEGDGLENLLEYLHDIDPQTPDPLASWSQEGTDGGGQKVHQFYFRRSTTASDAAPLFERTTDLLTWSSATLEELGATVVDPDPDGDGSAMLHMIELPLVPSGYEFIRLRVELISP